MLDAGVHFGHQIRRWHPKMEPYIYTVAKDIHIIDLEQSEKMLKTACEVLFNAAKAGKKIVFVGTKKQSRDIVELEAKRCGAMYVRERWIGGTVTNFSNIKRNLDKLIKYIKDRDEGNFEGRTKKERLLIDREIEKMLAVYGGIISMRSNPDILFVIDPKREKTAVREAKNAGIPTVAIVDTNADPTVVDYAIPGNDDAIKSIALLVKAVADAVEEGYKEFGKSKEQDSETIAKDSKDVAEKEVKEAKEDAPVVTATESPVATDTSQVAEIEDKLLDEVVEEAPKVSVKDSDDEKVAAVKEVKKDVGVKSSKTKSANSKSKPKAKVKKA